MKVVFIDWMAKKLPRPYGGGVVIVKWSIVQCLKEAGADIELHFFDARYSTEARIQELNDFKAEFVRRGIPFQWHSPQSHMHGNDTRHSQGIRDLQRHLDDHPPDMLFSYDLTKGVFAAEGLSHFRGSFLKVLFSIDPKHLVLLSRLWNNVVYNLDGQRYSNIYAMSKGMWTAWTVRKRLIHGYQKMDLHINHAAHHAAWIRRHCARPCYYLPNPVAPDTPPDLRPSTYQGAPRFLLVGHLRGVATLSGLMYFADKVLPHLTDALRSGELVIEVIGGDSVEPSIQRRFGEAGISFRGQISQLQLTQIYRDSAAMLVPTPLALGFRTRIVDAFLHALPVVAHEANAQGFPEISKCAGCIVTRSGPQFAMATLELARNPERRKHMAAQARRFWEENGTTEHYGKRVVEILQRASIDKLTGGTAGCDHAVSARV